MMFLISSVAECGAIVFVPCAEYFFNLFNVALLINGNLKYVFVYVLLIHIAVITMKKITFEKSKEITR